MAGRHVRIAQSGGGAVRHIGLGPVRGDALGAGRSHRRDAREVSAGQAAAPAARRPSGTSSRTPARDCRRRINTSRVSTTCSSSTPREPTDALADFAAITGKAAMPPRWALGYMQSHRTLEDETQMLRVIDTFREKRIPLDAVIYLGTGFAPVGWNTRQPSFDFNPNVFKRDPKAVLADMHARHVKVVVHMVPWDRDRLPTLHGTIPAATGETVDASHIESYWQQHVGLVQAGVDAFWPDEGDWFNLFERIKRFQLYYQGSLQHDAERPAVEPAAQRVSRHRAVGRLGLVGRHRHVVEDARGADRGRPQLLDEHRPVLGLGYRRLLSEPRVHRRALRALVPVRGVLRIVPLARTRVADAPAVELGRQRARAARVRQQQPGASARRRAQHRSGGAREPGHRARSPSGTPSFAISCCRTPTRSHAKPATAAFRSCARCGCTTRPTRPRARRATSSSGAATF